MELRMRARMGRALAQGSRIAERRHGTVAMPYQMQLSTGPELFDNSRRTKGFDHHVQSGWGRD